MKNMNIFQYILIIMFSFFRFLHTDLSLAQSIDGIIKDKNGNKVENALVILEELTRNNKHKYQYVNTKENGEFHFDVCERPGDYRLVVYNEGNIKEEKINYRGKKGERIKVTIGEKLYESKWFDKIIAFISSLIFYFLGLLSSPILENFKRNKMQKNINRMIKKSISELQKEIDTIDINDGEGKYRVIEEKFAWVKQNLETLLGYSWAVEKLKPEYYSNLQDKLDIIEQIKRSFPFNGKNPISNNLDFLRRYKKEITEEHKIFKNLINELHKE